MSSVYINEPKTHGKVVLHTTVGDLDIELWSKEAPLYCRNFVQLCLEGFYDNTIFYRIVKGFIVQGGDPTGTGHGGETVTGEPIPDEFHTRLKFTRMGLVAAAAPERDQNDSQFFFTLEESPELNGKHTIFGKVAGDTKYNLHRFQSYELVGERPVNPPFIKSVTVVSNPFDDIVPRKIEKATDSDEKKPIVKAVNNRNLLSFGDDLDEEDEEEFAVTMISSTRNSKKRKLPEMTPMSEDSSSEDAPKEPVKKKRKIIKKETQPKVNKHEEQLLELQKESKKLMKELKLKTLTDEEKNKENEERRLGRELLEERKKKYKKTKLTDKEKSLDIEMKLASFTDLMKLDDPNLTWVKETKLKFKKEEAIIPEFDKTEIDDQYIVIDPRNQPKDSNYDPEEAKAKALKQAGEWW
eukprot:TRINITY_DN1698_c0_g1_i1.p1 TRINITY_DN1698_c0_g1~~TRINITY_DN1698_c0_g1_i1.p1  ORF type:complete len:410 (+),score=110.78 TRINITY_DN1698_c0_g1_i1:76-1305(+)